MSAWKVMIVAAGAMIANAADRTIHAVEHDAQHSVIDGHDFAPFDRFDRLRE